MAFSFKNLFGKEQNEEYVEIDVNSIQPEENKVFVKPFVLKTYENVDEILTSLREGYTIAVVDIKPLKSKDIIELKRSIAKIKKTVDAIEGSIAGFGENTIIATPKFAQIHRPVEKKAKDTHDFLG
jgi:SepF-like predicted cell division protein (DUF552 family)